MRPVKEVYRCWAEVDLAALEENLAQIRALAGPQKKVLTVVKADAYGHGLRQIAALLMQGGSDLFGVANLQEARAIRSVGKGWPILMLGACLPFEIGPVIENGIMPAISSLEEAERFDRSAAQQNKSVSIHVKVDTGMGRLGVAPPELGHLLSSIRRMRHLEIKGIFTHYSSAEDDAAFTRRQREIFAQAVHKEMAQGQQFEWIHAQNSGGLLFERDDLCNTVRPGLLVYGIMPPSSRLSELKQPLAFRPALSWKCRVGFLKSVPEGTPLSYGHTCFTRKKSTLATVTVGYGDGYFRIAGNRASVLIGAKRCPVLGRVTMDQAIVDVTDAGNVQAGDEVVLLGSQGTERIDATQLAEWCETVPWEVLTNITYRVPRTYRGGHAA